MSTSAFAKYHRKAWPHCYKAVMEIDHIRGGVPTDPKVAEGWIKTKLGSTDDLLRAQVAEVMVERGVGAEEAAGVVDATRHLNGFKRDPEHGLYFEGRQVKAAIKEAASIAVAAERLALRGWGKTNKWLLAFIAEHVCVVEDRLYLGVHQPTGVYQKFVHTRFGSAIAMEEYVEKARVPFTVETDWKFTDEQWAMIWLTGEQQGIGASRSQGAGRYTITEWEKVR